MLQQDTPDHLSKIVKSHVPMVLLPYYHHRDELAVSDGITIKGEWVVIQSS